MWVLGAVLGSLLVLACALLAVVLLRGQRQLAQRPGAFRCNLRLVRGVLAGVTSRWRRRPASASWAHDVLLIRSGRLPTVTQVLEVRFPEGSVSQLSGQQVRGLGPRPVVLRLRLDQGVILDVAAPAADRDRLVGPFLAAALAPSSERKRRDS